MVDYYKEQVIDWLKRLLEMNGDMCVTPPFPQKSAYWNGEIMSLSRVVCGEKNGWNVDLLLMPVRTCGTARCVNGKHYRWGSRKEAAGHRAVPRNHDAEKNPNAKLSWEAVRDIRKEVGIASLQYVHKTSLTEGLRSPRGSVITHAQAMTRRELAGKYGVSLKTIDKVVRGEIWVESKNGDEF